MSQDATIKCPNCNTSIDVNDLVKHQIEENIRREFQAKAQQQADEMNKRMAQLEFEKKQFEEKKRHENELFAERLEKEKKAAEKLLSEQLKKKIEEEQREQFETLNKELTEKSEKLRELHKATAEIAKLQREKEEMKEKIEAQAQLKLNEQLHQEKEKIRKAIEEQNELRIAALNKQLEDQKKLTEEMKRKQEQGSMQLQGEVMELAIEEYLMKTYPLDTIDEIKKGALGADCIQIVNTYEKQNCGTIYYESKRTKNFQPAWIEKFKNDIRSKRATIGVLVTEVMPADMHRMGMRDGIWICTFEEFKGLSAVLRETVIQLHQAVASQENKGDKMVMLYDFLTSNEFRLQIEGIVEGFTTMQADLQKEKNAMYRIWNTREKQIEKVIQNTIGMYGSIKGIAGNAVQTVQALEFDSDVEQLLD